MHSETEFFFGEKIVPLCPIIKIWVKGYKIKTIHVQYTGTQQIHLYLIGSNIQFSTNTEKEQVIIKKTCNNEQIEFLCI